MSDDMENEKKKLTAALDAVSSGSSALRELVVNAPFATLLPLHYDIGTIVLLIDNQDSGCIERVALSSTPAAEGAVAASAVPFTDIKIPRDFADSAHVKALKDKQAVVVTDWHELFTPALTWEQARDNQHRAGITTSLVQPFAGKQQGTLIFSLYSEPKDITEDAKNFFNWYADLVAERIV